MTMHHMPKSCGLGPEALDLLMPMHAVIDQGGQILHIGPTLAKILPEGAGVGDLFDSHFIVRRRQMGKSVTSIATNSKLRMRLRDPEGTPLIGTAVSLGSGNLLLNLSFGIAVVDAVRRFSLAGSDFAHTDLTVELLYLVEAKSTAMDATRQLNTRLHGDKKAAEAEALTDTLTGLGNRRALDASLSRLLARKRPFTLMNLDLDFFKAVNDTLGHAAGDAVLCRVAEILNEETREDDEVARIGGDEFVLIFNAMTDEKRLSAIASRIIHRLEVPIEVPGGTARISASIGMARSISFESPDAERMLRDADIALYASKGRGRACHTIYTAELGDEVTPQPTL